MQQNTTAPHISTLGELRTSGYTSRSVKDELRANLIRAMKEGRPVFQGVWGFEDTVIPDLERAILSRHHMLLLGLRGQAKTRLARLLVDLLDEWSPCLAGCELPEDPLAPITAQAQDILEQKGDAAPIYWRHRSERYVEKLATPDVSVADLIGDIDPIKAASLRLSYADEQVMHFGLVPRAHRGIFVINELPDLQPRIQVALFNILQEGDIQIRGFVRRMQLDIQFMFTANPEDYTNRGSIITPLKDRIDSQILTHYPVSRAISQRITLQEVRLTEAQREQVQVAPIIHDVLDQIGFEARESEYIDGRSGVSARMSVTAYENLVSGVERRLLRSGESRGSARILDFWGVVPAITGKVELVYEGEQEGAYQVALHLIQKAVRQVFLQHFPHPEQKRRKQERDPYTTVLAWFAGGNQLELLGTDSESVFAQKLQSVAGLAALVENQGIDPSQKWLFMELVLHALADFQQIGKEIIGPRVLFRDELAGALGDLDLEGEE